jgi:hypothetical protein
MFKTLHGFYDLDVLDFVSFVNHSRTRNCNNPSLVLKFPSRKSSTFQSSFFNRIVPLWNHTCKIASPGDLRSLAMFKSFLSRTCSRFNLLLCWEGDQTSVAEHNCHLTSERYRVRRILRSVNKGHVLLSKPSNLFALTFILLIWVVHERLLVTVIPRSTSSFTRFNSDEPR